MNENNLEYLQNNLKYLGFGEELNPKLRESIENGLVNFSLAHKIAYPAVNAKEKPELADHMNYSLEFSKSKESDMYFFNKYTATKVSADQSESVAQQFYINKGKGVTAKESYNLLSGRAVNKDVVLKSGEKANLWLRLDLLAPQPDGFHEVKNYGEKYGFDLAAVVDKFQISDMDKKGFKDQLIKSLEKGNLHGIAFSKDKMEVKGFVSANPQFKTLDFYDQSMKSVYSKSVGLNEGVKEEQSAEKVEKQPALEEVGEAKEIKKGRGR